MRNIPIPTPPPKTVGIRFRENWRSEKQSDGVRRCSVLGTRSDRNGIAVFQKLAILKIGTLPNLLITGYDKDRRSRMVPIDRASMVSY